MDVSVYLASPPKWIPLPPPSRRTGNPSNPSTVTSTQSQNRIPDFEGLNNSLIRNLDVFDIKQAIPKPDFEGLKNTLIRYADAGDIKQAVSTLDFMSQNGLTPDLTSYSILLKSCIRARNFHLGKLVHSKLMESSLKLDSIVLNTLITLYSKSGDWATAERIFESMGEDRDMVSWSAMISCFAHNDMELDAILTFFEMLECGEQPNQFCFSAAIQACCSPEYAWFGPVLFGLAMKKGYFGDLNVGCALIDLFSRGFGDLKLAKEVFDKMPVKNHVTWTLMISRFSQFGLSQSAIELFLDMLLDGLLPDIYTYSGVLSACAELEWSSLGQQLHASVIKSGLSADVCVGCSLVDMYAKCCVDRPMVDSRKVFDRMLVHNVMSWTAIIAGYIQNAGKDLEAIELYHMLMEDGSVRPNHFTFSALLKACGNISNVDLGKNIYGQAVKLGFGNFDGVSNALISLYAKCDKTEDARKAFELLFEKSFISYDAVVDEYVKDPDSEKAFEPSSQIQISGIEVDAFTFANLLSGAASVGAIGKGEQIHAKLVKAGFESNQTICNALISMYSRCGNIEAAFQVFKDMSDWNVVSWTAIITGFAKHGYARRALELFNEMILAGVKPNEVTYVSVLSACSHAGMVEEGLKHFHNMSSEHGIVPRMEHYSCMVDILARSGFLEKAVTFIESMPFDADTLVWRTLLGACCVHGNKELGKQAAKMILKQNPADPAAYVLLSNLYASGGHWEEVANIRKDMKERNLLKEAGYSWIETENKVHKFYVGDTEHPQSKEIYEELHQLVRKIKPMGYTPNTKLVLHEVEEEQKEQFLLQHSEKLAVAFGLISTSKPKPIRIFKNLRVCGDCHSAIKYISLATGREIVVRDSNRFHHMIDGKCSCNDYW